MVSENSWQAFGTRYFLLAAFKLAQRLRLASLGLETGSNVYQLFKPFFRPKMIIDVQSKMISK
jgi:hypothetical protein